MRTGYLYLNYAHAGQNLFGEGQRKERLRGFSGKYEAEGVFQRAVPGAFKQLILAPFLVLLCRAGN